MPLTSIPDEPPRKLVSSEEMPPEVPLLGEETLPSVPRSEVSGEAEEPPETTWPDVSTCANCLMQEE